MTSTGSPAFIPAARFPESAIAGLPWSPEFMAAYETALAGQPLEVGNGRTKPGTTRALAVSYFNSTGFRAGDEHAIGSPQHHRPALPKHRDKRAATLQREHVIKLMAARAERPGAANWLRKVLRAMMKHAVEIGLRTDDPTRDAEGIRIKSDGHHSWTDAEIAQFERHHAVGSRARLAFALLLFTGQRRGDVIRMGRQHVRDGFLSVKQMKTGAVLNLPVHAELAAVISASATGHLTFLVTRLGQPFPGTGFSTCSGRSAMWPACAIAAPMGCARRQRDG